MRNYIKLDVLKNMMELKQQFNTTQTTTVLTTTIVLSAIFVLSTLANDNEVFAKEIDIKNNLDVSLIFNEVENRQDVKIDSKPPDEVKAGDTGKFEVSHGEGGGVKAKHLKVQYYVGEKGSDETVSFGFKSKSSQGYEWNDFNCFTNTPDEIKGSYDHCNSGTTGYTFTPK